MSAVLVDWLVGVRLQFHLLQETLYSSVSILGRIFEAKVDYIPRYKLQTMGVAAMLVAGKFKEVYLQRSRFLTIFK